MHHHVDMDHAYYVKRESIIPKASKQNVLIVHREHTLQQEGQEYAQVVLLIVSTESVKQQQESVTNALLVDISTRLDRVSNVQRDFIQLQDQRLVLLVKQEL